MVKRLEHFWKGLSSPESQISAVPPDRYGDRFIKFISGITKSRERAEAEKEQQLDQESAKANHAAQDVEGTVNDPRLTGVNILKNNHNPVGTDIVMRKAEKQAEQSRLRGANEDDIPDRAITAVRSPHPENENMVTLPVIGEAAENGSSASRTPTHTITPQHSKDSFRGRGGNSKQAIYTDAADMATQQPLGEVPPPTPPKTDGPPSSKRSIEFDQSHGRSVVNNFSRPLTPPKDEKYRLRDERSRPPTPPKDERYGIDKALPLPPSSRVVTGDVDGSGIADQDEIEALRTRVSGLST
jgi:1-phosphatidylinositol-4-phosphate 5-kinase